jgi:hypothetical protein
MYKPDILDEIIDKLSPEKIPSEFILMAKVRTLDGKETIVYGNELDQLMNEKGDEIADVRVILDVKLIRQVIVTETNAILAAVRAPLI